MTRLAIALDLGTSGFRTQAIDLFDSSILSTVVTTRHPLPGANSLDHVQYALDFGLSSARAIVIEAVNRMIRELGVPVNHVVRLAVCGNPVQLSIFHGTEIRDLAFAGSRKLSSLGVTAPDRNAVVLMAREFPGLCLPGDCAVLIPPSVRHEVGADALALIIQSGMLDRPETAVAIDFGTNAEMALLHNGRVFTGSAAAGPALEGQHISFGMLAGPWAVSDLEPSDHMHRMILLNEELLPVHGSLVDLRCETVCKKANGPSAIGITGTGTIAIINQAMEAGHIALPVITTPDNMLHLGPDIVLTEDDVIEAGKAIGAIRAGVITLCHEAGILPADIRVAYMGGASGTYVDAAKVFNLGMIPPGVRTVYQIGNTSLAMARDLATEPAGIEKMSHLAGVIRQTHCMFAASDTFKKVYILEYSFWTEGMPWDRYRKLLGLYGLPDLPPAQGRPDIIHTVHRDIEDLGRGGLRTVTDIGRTVSCGVEGCTLCRLCEAECPGKALAVSDATRPASIALDLSLCEGWACRHCEECCPEKVFSLRSFLSIQGSTQTIADGG